MKRMVFLLFTAFLAALIFSCTQQLAGNGSEITNGFCIADAAPAESATVVAYPKNYIPSSPRVIPETTFTDSKGHFSLRLRHASWNLVIYDRAQVLGAFIPLPNGDSAIDTIVLKELGAIAGIVNDTIGDPRYIGIIGSPFYAAIFGKTDSFSLAKIPPYYYSITIWHPIAGISDSGIGTAPPNDNLISTGAAAPVIVEPDSIAWVIINN